jgi:hypothetical protein
VEVAVHVSRYSKAKGGIKKELGEFKIKKLFLYF